MVHQSPDEYARLNAATASEEPPVAIVDLTAFDTNAVDLVQRAQGTPIRLATKSVRVRGLIERALSNPGFAGAMAFSLREALWLARGGVDDVLVGYPTVDRQSITELRADEALAESITLMVDDVTHLNLISSISGAPVRLCLDIDTSWRPLGAVVGARRSPVRTPDQAVVVAQEIERRDGLRLVGVLTYEGQIAGVPDSNVAVRQVQSRSAADIADRRHAILTALRPHADLEFVNAGGTGNLGQSAAAPDVTEVTAGSGLMGSTLFDHYRSFTPQPAALFALPVVRRPGPGVVTVFSGGWIASGPSGRDRSPTPYLPSALRLTRMEGAGEVQTPLIGRTADALGIGDRVWFRHTKSGEPFEHVSHVHLIDGDRVVATAPTYRGDGQTFGL